jgi:hypothetical protein
MESICILKTLIVDNQWSNLDVSYSLDQDVGQHLGNTLQKTSPHFTPLHPFYFFSQNRDKIPKLLGFPYSRDFPLFTYFYRVSGLKIPVSVVQFRLPAPSVSRGSAISADPFFVWPVLVLISSLINIRTAPI